MHGDVRLIWRFFCQTTCVLGQALASLGNGLVRGPILKHRFKIAYLCDFSPLDTNSYSGGNARILKALEAHVGDVQILDAGWGLAEPLRKLCHMLPEALNLRLRWRLHVLLGPIIARHVQKQLRAGDFDVLFCAYSFQSLKNVRAPEGMMTVFTADATPTIYKHSEIGRRFGSYFALSRWLDPLFRRAERGVLMGCDLCLWPTEWMKTGAEEVYDLPQDKGQVIPWGANVDDPGPSDLAPSLAADQPLKLLVIGRDFYAKGGACALEAIEYLRQKGIDARLDIIGQTPPEVESLEFVTAHGHLNKAKPGEMQRFEAVLRAAHFLIQPSFESYGFAFCEASAYGLPSLCLRVGGVPVRDGVNGHALPLGSGGSDFAQIIERYLNDPEGYAALRASARGEYEAHLNWPAWGRSVYSALLDIKK